MFTLADKDVQERNPEHEFSITKELVRCHKTTKSWDLESPDKSNPYQMWR